MRKLLELREDKHADVIQAIEAYKREHQCTFVEAIRRLVLLGHSCNGTEPVEGCDNDRLEDLEKKVGVLIRVAQKKFGLKEDEEEDNVD